MLYQLCNVLPLNTYFKEVKEKKHLSAFSSLHAHAVALKLFLFPEKHAETDNSAVDEQTTQNRHDHCGKLDGTAVGENGGKCCCKTVSNLSSQLRTWVLGNTRKMCVTYSHEDQEPGQEPAKVNDGAAGAFNKIIGIPALATDPVW